MIDTHALLHNETICDFNLRIFSLRISSFNLQIFLTFSFFLLFFFPPWRRCVLSWVVASYAIWSSQNFGSAGHINKWPRRLTFVPNFSPLSVAATVNTNRPRFACYRVFTRADRRRDRRRDRSHVATAGAIVGAITAAIDRSYVYTKQLSARPVAAIDRADCSDAFREYSLASVISAHSHPGN